MEILFLIWCSCEIITQKRAGMIIKNVKVFDKKMDRIDIRVSGGKIVYIAKNIEAKSAKKVIDASEMYLIPKIVELNLMLKDNIFNKKNMQKLCQKAKKSGVGSFVLNSDFLPTLNNETFLELFNSQLKNNLGSNVIVSIPAIDENNRLNNISTLINGGAEVIELNSDVESNLIKRVMQYAKLKNGTIFCYIQNSSLDENGMMNDGEISFKLGLGGISKTSELSEVAKVVEMAKYFDVKVIFKTISLSDSLKIINRAKKINPKIYAEVSLQNLVLNENECDKFNTNAKLKPPLREEKQRKKLLKMLKKGKIDFITSAHSPKSIGYKDLAFSDALFGTSSVEHFLKIAYTHLVKTEIIDMQTLINLICINPAKILNLKTAKLKLREDANFILFNPKIKTKIDDKDSIYHNKEVFGEIILI